MPSPAKLAKMGKPTSKMLRVRADTLQPHPMAQRELVPSRLRKLNASLDLDAIGVLHVVQYAIKGKTAMWIVDGQHRWRSLMDNGFGEWEVELKLHSDVTDDAGASALFLKLNDRSPVSPYDKFLNRLMAKEDDAISINDIVLKHKMKISRSAADGHIVGIGALEKTYRLDEGEALDKTLGLITEAWGLRSIDAKVIEGLGLVCARYNGTLEYPAFVRKLSKYPGTATGLVGDARKLMDFRKVALSRAIGELAIGLYNKGRSSGKLDPL